MSTIYVVSNTDLQVLDTFNPPVDQQLIYRIKYGTYDTEVVVDHDGVSCYEEQTSVGTRAYDFSANVSAGVGRLWFQPTQNNTILIDKEFISSNSYGVNTKAGKFILSSNGFGVDFSSNTQCIKPSSYSDFAYQSSVLANTNLVGEWISRNDHQISGNTFITSTQYQSYSTQKIVTKYGSVYNLSGSISIELDTALASGDVHGDLPSLKIGTTENAQDLGVIKTNGSFDLDVVSYGDLYITVGSGEALSRLTLDNFIVKERLPFSTYDSQEGTWRFKWISQPNNTVLFTSGSNQLKIGPSGNVLYNTTDLGSQQANNILVQTYELNTSTITFNGSNTSVSYSLGCGSWSSSNLSHLTYMDEVITSARLRIDE